ncbi:cytidine deaminase, partial [Streptomyces sp. SID3343]|nr:cytidine deaminase [Streptomyces sp. SID3343]
GLEAAALVGDVEHVAEADLAAVRDLGGADTPILVAGPDAVVRAVVTV